MRDEIQAKIGDRIPVQTDRNNCHYAIAFLYEVMRVKPLAPSLPHNTMFDSKIGKYRINIFQINI